MTGPGTPLDPPSAAELAAFVAAVESSTIQGAADALMLTQSAATKRVQALERRLGGQLLERGRFGVRPTPLGRTIYAPAKRALADLDEIDRAARDAATSTAALRIASSLTIGEFLLPAWLGRFRLAQPHVQPELEVINSHAVLAAVRAGTADVGFVEGIESLTRCESLVVARDRLLVVVDARHPWARRRAIGTRDLANGQYLTREAASGTRAVADAALAAAGVTLHPALQAASLQSLKRALGDGGFTIISELTIDAERRAGQLVGLPVRKLSLDRELHAIRLRRRGGSAAAAAFWNWLRTAIAQGIPAPGATS